MTSDAPAHLVRLNPEQYDAVTHTVGPLLILAGAGSGKTRVLTRRIAHIIHTGVDPENILAVTFTNKAAMEMKERVAELIGEAGRKVWVSTFHASCCRILRQEAEHLGYTKKFAIYDDDDQNRVIRQIMVDLGYDLKVVPPAAIMGKIDHYKNRMMGVDQLVREHRIHGNDPVIRVWREYEEALRAADAVDFNDLIGKAVELFEHHPDVLAKYRDRFRFVLVDEYQDTNRAQYRLLRLLTAEHRNLAVVGDDDQSIYAFRGADISNILNFESDFPEAKVVRLERNYRSTENILAVANAVVAKNEDRIAKRLWTDAGSGARVTLMITDDPKAEARMVAQGIQTLRRRGSNYGDIAVIYRTNATSQPYEAAFREHGIPYHVVGGRQFYARREIRDATSFLRLIVNPADDQALLRVINVPPRGIGPQTVTKLREEAASRGEPLLKTARGLGRGGDRNAKAIGAFVHLIDGLAELSREVSLPILAQQVLERSGYKAMLEAEDSHDARSRIENLRQLLKDAAQFVPENPDAPPDERLGQWLDRMTLTGSDEDVPEGGVVTMMTVHTSKGLEYPIVFVVHMTEGQFPHARAAGEPGGVEEERRLAYVAFTRAQKRLIVTRCRKETSFDPTTGKVTETDAAPSRFLFGIPVEACEGDLPGEIELPPVPAALRKPKPPTPERMEPVRNLAQRDAEARRATVATRNDLLRALAPKARMQPNAASLATPARESLPTPGAYTTMDIESVEQLEPGVRVFHDLYGPGDVVLRSASVVQVRFQDRLRRVGLAEGRLHLLRDG